MCRHNFLEKYSWIHEFDGKLLTIPATANPFIKIEFIENETERIQHHAQFETNLPFAVSSCFNARIIEAKQLVNADDDERLKDVYEIIVQIQDEALEFAPGDTVGVLPKQSEGVVSLILERNTALASKQHQHILLKIDASAGNGKKPPKFPIHLPTNATTICKLLQESLDLRAIPKKTLISALLNSNCVTDPSERRALEILCSREGAAIYTTEILQKQKTFLDLFVDFQSLRFSCDTIGVLFEQLPRLMPRPYSIASSPSIKSNEVIELNSTEFKVIFSVDRPAGVTTKYLEKLVRQQHENRSEELTIDLYLRKSTKFRLTDGDYTAPIIMIATGTGIAPFLGFLDHRNQQITHRSHNATLPYSHERSHPGRSWLIHGSRTKKAQICRHELLEHLKNGSLSKLSEVFSREKDNSETKYVQSVIRENAEEFVDFFLKHDNHGSIITKTFICGSSNMVQDVQSVIQQCLIAVTGCSESEAQDRISSMKKTGLYVEDAWV